jgi:hypothetical protein
MRELSIGPADKEPHKLDQADMRWADLAVTTRPRFPVQKIG